MWCKYEHDKYEVPLISDRESGEWSENFTSVILFEDGKEADALKDSIDGGVGSGDGSTRERDPIGNINVVVSSGLVELGFKRVVVEEEAEELRFAHVELLLQQKVQHGCC